MGLGECQLKASRRCRISGVSGGVASGTSLVSWIRSSICSDPGRNGAAFDRERRVWLESALETDSATILAMHHPPFTTGVDWMDAQGFIGIESENLVDLFHQQSVAGSIGPGVRWNVLNYGRIRNNVRANEAKFHQLVLDYQNTVLAANQEVEDGIVSFLKERDRGVSLNESATQARRAVDISTTQYQRGRINFQPVVYMQQILAARQDELAVSRGAVAGNLVSIYKALGGGWQTRMNAAGMPLEVAPATGEDAINELTPLLPIDAPLPAAPTPPETAPIP